MYSQIQTELDEVKLQVARRFPAPREYALADDTAAFDIMSRIRSGQSSFDELSFTELKYSYHMAKLCDNDEFRELQKVFAERATSAVYSIGWDYCQINADNDKAVALFAIIYEKIRKTRPEIVDKGLAGRAGMPWDEIFHRSAEIMHIEKLKPEQFCARYEIIPNTVFYYHLMLAYLSKCEKDVLKENEALLTQLMAVSKIEFLKPAIKNYTTRFGYEEMSQDFINALLARLSTEASDNALGISPNTLQMMRLQRFNGIIENLTGNNRQKTGMYSKVSGKIRNIEPLNKGVFAVDFGTYMVVDCTDWNDKAFAFKPDVYRQMLDKWVAEGYPEEFWPGTGPEKIVAARDVVLGVMKSDIVRLGFSHFDMLYTRDLLIKNIY